jgi:hypothetical protein
MDPEWTASSTDAGRGGDTAPWARPRPERGRGSAVHFRGTACVYAYVDGEASDITV